MAPEVPPLPDFSRWGPVQQVPLQSVRRTTARQMNLAWAQIPHVMHQDVADITALEMFRRRHTAEVERHGEAEPDGPGAAGGGRVRHPAL